VTLAIKRALDLVVASVLTVTLAPVGLVVAIAILMSMGTPVLFSQVRIGRGGAEFRVYKFRTMRVKLSTDEPDSQRVTVVGRILRRASLDELPQLFNVVKGDMSLVGPRPLLPRYMPWYNDDEQRRFDVRPGITGLAQINGRNQVGWDERLALDCEYAATLSLTGDLAILARTLVLLTCPGRGGVVDDPTSAMLDFDEHRRKRSSQAEGSSPGGTLDS